jgi:hypothetical protein
MPIARRAISFWFVGLAAFMLIVWFPYGALQDLPEWIYQGCVFNQLWSGHAHAAQEFYLKTYPVPYTSVQLLISGFLVLFDPIMTSKLIVVLYGTLSVWVTHRLIKTFDLDRGLAWPVLIAAFVLNGPFWNGYMGFQFGLVLFVLYLSLRLEQRTHWAVLVTFSVLAFFTHGIIFFAVILASGAYSLKERRLLVFIPAMLPSALLASWYVLKNVTPAVGGVPVLLPDFVTAAEYKIYTFLKLGPYHNFVIFGADDAARFGRPFLVLGIMSNVAFLTGMVLLVLAGVRTNWRIRVRSAEFLAGGVLVSIAAVLTPTALGVGNPGERLLYPAFVLFTIIALSPPRPSSTGRLRTAASLVLSIGLVVGFALSSAGLIGAGISYGRKDRTAHGSSGEPVGDGRDRTLFAHRLVQFDDRMKETERAWRAGESLTLPLAFDTALLGQRDPHRAP